MNKIKNIGLSLVVLSFLSISLGGCNGDSDNSTTSSSIDVLINNAQDDITNTEKEQVAEPIVNPNSSKVHLKGRFSSNLITYAPAKNKKRSYSNIGSMNQILALAVKDGKANLSLTKTVPIESNGNFSVEFEKNDDTDWVMMMSNSDATKIDEKLGNFVSLSEGDVGLTSIPMGKALEDIDMGKLTIKDDETSSSNSISDVSGNFSQNVTKLLMSAKLDSSAKGAKNDYLNSNNGIHYQSWLDFKFYDIDAYNRFSNVETYKNFYGGWSTEITTNQFTNLDMPQLCNGDYNIKFIPPAEIESIYDYEIHSPNNPYDDKDLNTFENGNACSNDVGLGFRSDDIYKDVHISIQTFAGDVPAGYWKLTSNDKTLAAFDFAIGSIFDKDGDFQVLVPSVKFTVNAKHQIEKIDFKWYIYNKDKNQFEEVFDKGIIKKFSSYCSVAVTDYDGIDNDKNRIDDSITIIDYKIYKTEITDFNKEWYVTGNTDNSKITVDSVMVSLKVSEYLTVSYNYKF